MGRGRCEGGTKPASLDHVLTSSEQTFGTRRFLQDAVPFVEATAAVLVGPSLLCSLIAASHDAQTQSLVFLGMAAALALPAVAAWNKTSALAVRSKRALAVLALAWVLASFVAAIPFVFLGRLGSEIEVLRSYGEPHLALFEAVSGLTSTGLTVCARPEQLPPSLQFWRSCLQWVGGIGLAAFVAPFIRRHRKRLFSGEVDVPEDEREPGLILKWVLGGYVVLTAICFSGLLLLGIAPWEALNHSLSAAATGGFTMTNESLRHYDRAQLSVVAVTTIISASSLPMLVHWARRDGSPDLARPQNLQLFSYLFVLVAGVLGCFLIPSWAEGGAFEAAFNWISATSTSGFDASDVDAWSRPIWGFVVFTMLIGACHSSTGGGIKHSRLLTLLSRVKYMRRTRTKRTQSAASREAMLVAVSWCSMVALATPVVSLAEEVSLRHALFEVASAAGGVGLSTGVSSAELSVLGAGTLSVVMLLGRLEIFAFLLLLLEGLPWDLPSFVVERSERRPGGAGEGSETWGTDTSPQ